MRKFLCFTGVLFLLSTSALLAQTWGPFSADFCSDFTTLAITRTADTTPNVWDWTYAIHNGCPNAGTVEEFSVGVLAGGKSGHYFNLTESGVTGVQILMSNGNLLWSFDPLVSGGSDMTKGNATFSFQTDLPSVGLANHQLRDDIYTPSWGLRQTPATPEPASFLALAVGLVGLVGKLKRK